MFNKRRVVLALMVLAVALTLLAVLPRWSGVNAQQFGTQVVGAWYGNVNLPGLGGFPFMSKFNSDGTWSGDDARSFGLLPNFPQKTTTFIGSWTRAGDRTFRFRALQVDHGPLGPNQPDSYQIVRVEGSVRVPPGDFNHLIGTTGVMVIPCPADGSGFGFSCPDPLAVPFTPIATFDYTLSRILPPA